MDGSADDEGAKGLAGLDAAGAAIFLDFDGVLVDIAETPDAVRVDSALPEMLDRLHAVAGGALAIVSGRAVESVRAFLPGFPGAIAGCHGAEIARPGTATERPVDPDPRQVRALQGLVEDIAASDPAYLAESKPTGAVLHYRRRPELEGEAWRRLAEGLEAFEGFHIHRSKMAFEIRPDGASKGEAVAALMREAPFAGRRPVYLGDDATDEPAFAVANAEGGISVKIGEGETEARWRLPGVAEAHAALGRLAGGAPASSATEG